MMHFDDPKVRKRIFAAYCVLMLLLLFGRTPMSREDTWGYLNLVPFRTVGNYLYALIHMTRVDLLPHIIINLAGNVVMFVPLGFCQPWIWERMRSFPVCMALTALEIILVETLQLATCLGCCDVDDLILNVAGAAVGYALYKGFYKK